MSHHHFFSGIDSEDLTKALIKKKDFLTSRWIFVPELFYIVLFIYLLYYFIYLFLLFSLFSDLIKDNFHPDLSSALGKYFFFPVQNHTSWWIILYSPQGCRLKILQTSDQKWVSSFAAQHSWKLARGLPLTAWWLWGELLVALGKLRLAGWAEAKPAQSCPCGVRGLVLSHARPQLWLCGADKAPG